MYFFVNSLLLIIRKGNKSGLSCQWEDCWGHNSLSFTTPKRLIEHMRAHTYEKPFIVIKTFFFFIYI